MSKEPGIIHSRRIELLECIIHLNSTFIESERREGVFLNGDSKSRGCQTQGTPYTSSG